MSSSNYCFLTYVQVSQEGGQVVWYSHHLKNFPVCCDPHSQGLWRSQWNRSRCFSGTLLLFLCSSGCWQFDLWFLPFLNPAWTCGSSWFMHCLSLAWRILSITLLSCEMSEIVRWFEHSLALPFFGIRMKTDLFQSCCHCWVFQICWHIECSTFTTSSFRLLLRSPPVFSLC